MPSNQPHTADSSARFRSPLVKGGLQGGLRQLKSLLGGNRILWVIILLGLIARIGSALYQGNTISSLPGVFDQISYHKLALRVQQGHGFSFGTGWWPATPANQPTAHWSYLYVLFLTSVYSIVGPSPLTARLIQAILTGILQPLITWQIARRLFGPRVGLVSAALISFYAYFVFYAGALVTESLYIVAILWILDISTSIVDPSDRNSIASAWKPWVQLGIALALASLLRQVILPLVPVILVWVGWQVHRRTPESRLLGRCRRPKPSGGLSDSRQPTPVPLRWRGIFMPWRWRPNPLLGGERRLQPSGVGRHTKTPVLPLLSRMTLAVLMVLALILPWTVRNYRAFGQFVLLNTNAGFAFFWGNHPIHGTQFIPLLPDYGTLIPEELRGLNEAGMDKALLRQGVAFVLNDPARYLLLSISRAKEYFKFWPSQNSGALSNFARALSFGLCLPFLVSGLLLAVLGVPGQAGCNHHQDRSGVMLLILVSGLYSLVHLMTWTLVRYRLPVDAITMPFTALSMVYAYDRVFGTVRIRAVPLPNSAD
jgi:Dolichyl-phosphate-mannose-protein mannosyltransferase